MRIGVDVSCWANGRGYGRFARELMREMVALAPEHEFVCFGDTAAFRAFPLAAANLRMIAVSQQSSPATAAAADGYRSPSDMFRLSRAVRQERPDVFFSPSVYTYFPLPPGQRAVVTVHDTIAERFPSLTLPSARARWFWRLKVRVALWQARLVLTVSEFAAADLVRILGVSRARLRIAHEAPSAAFHPAPDGEVAEAATRAGLPPAARWFTYVGGFSPHKRVDIIIRAHAALAADNPSPPHLLLIGCPGGDPFLGVGDALHLLVAEYGTGSLVHWTGFLPDDQLRALHTGAVASLLPSECEGFGLPAVEAAACGTPVIATTESPLPRLLEGGGRFVRPGDASGLAQAMAELLGDEPARVAMGKVAAERARRLSWRDGARAALDALGEAAA